MDAWGGVMRFAAAGPRGGGVKALAVGAACALAAALAPASAAAEVTIGPSEITVAANGAGAVVTRSPFGIRFTDASGETVLAEVHGAGAPPLERSVVDPASGPTGETLYAPLSFLVGNDSEQTYTTSVYAGKLSGQYSGDLASVEESGTEYSAREVLEARAEGEGVHLVVSTNDPSGRTLTVTIEPESLGSHAAIRVAARPSQPEGVAAMSDSFDGGSDGGLPRLRRQARRPRPARAGILQLGRPGERDDDPRTAV